MNSLANTSRFLILVLFIFLISCIKKDIPPTINDQSFSIDENAPVGTIVGKVIASDEDGQIESFSIFSGNTNDAFLISETDGTITVKNLIALNFEVTPSFILSIKVTDDKRKSSLANITINLNNIDETPCALSISSDRIKFGNILTIYGKYFNTETGATTVTLSYNSLTYNLSPFFISPDSLKIKIYNHQNPTSALDLASYRIGINTLGTNNWSDIYFNLISSWNRVADFTGGGRYKSTAFTLGTNLFVSGGTGNGIVYKDFWSYNPGNNSWTRLADIPGSARVYPRSFANELYGYVGAGYTTDNSSKVQLYDFYKYNPQNSSWSSISNYPDNILNFYVGFTVTVNNRPYISLSNQNPAIQEVINDSWSSHSSISEMIDCPAAGVFSIGSKFYVLAGYTINNTVSNALWEYNVTTSQWTRKANFPGTARFAPAFFSIGNYGYYGCGMSTNQQQYKDFWRYDPSDDTWIRLEDFPGGNRSHTISTSVGNSGFVGFGLEKISTSFLYDFWKFNPTN